MSKLYVIFGKSATGKDTLYGEIMSRNPKIKNVVTYTTRPMREGEKEGVEYHFVTDDGFEKLKESGKIVEYRKYNTVHGIWYYFTADDGQVSKDGEDIYLVISTLEGYLALKKYYGDMVKPIYVNVDDVTRISRAINREKDQETPCISEVCRRFLADEEDFSEDKLEAAGIVGDVIVSGYDKEEAISTIENMMFQ